MIKREKNSKKPEKNGGSLRSPPAGGGGVCGSRGWGVVPPPHPHPLLAMPGF